MSNYLEILNSLPELQDCKQKICHWLEDQCIDETDKKDILDLLNEKKSQN